MATLTTKYSIGDVVYYASTSTERRQHPCPDCKGTKKWKAISPAEREYEFACPRCSASYQNNLDLRLDYATATPVVTRLTIGNVKFNSETEGYDAGASYMCHETGIGSGSVYRENRLFPTEEEALIAAQGLAAASNATTPWIVKQYNETLKVSDYQIGDAAMKLAEEARSRARAMLWNIGDLFSKIEEAKTLEEVREAVDDYRMFDWARDKEKAAA